MDLFNIAPEQPPVSSWQPWAAVASTDDDSWEDVTDIAAKPAVIHPPPSITPASSKAVHGVHQEEGEGYPTTEVRTSSSDNATDSVASFPNIPDPAMVVSLERKIVALTHERDALRRARDRPGESAELSALRAEGGQLSARVADREATARMLRSSLHDREAELAEAKDISSALAAKLEAAQSRVRALEASERANTSALTTAEERIRALEAETRARGSSSAALDAARAQLESARRAHAQALEDVTTRATCDRDAAVEQARSMAQSREQSFQNALKELRSHLAEVTDRAGCREDALHKEIDEVRARARDLEVRNDELVAALSKATRPLLRQVEALQAAAGERVRARTVLERSAVERLRAAEAASLAASERETEATRRADELSARVAELEQAARMSDRIAEQTATDLVLTRRELKDLYEQMARANDANNKKIRDISSERDTLKVELRCERAVALDSKDTAESRELELRAALAASETHTKMSHEIGPEKVDDSWQSDGLQAVEKENEHSSGERESVNQERDGVYAEERGRTCVRLREGAVKTLQTRLEDKEAATQALAEEVVKLTGRLEALTHARNEDEDARDQLSSLQQRYITLLELLGEREERITELEADLVDVKCMNKEQVTELLLRIERLTE